MNKFYIAIQNPSGDAKALSRVQVLDSGGSIVTIYSDSGGTRFTDDTGANVNYCVADAEGMVEFYWTAATSQTLQILDSAGNLERSIADFANNYSTPEAEADVSTILGATVADGDFGTFTGTTIADDSTAKVALQALETAVETKTTATTLAATGGAALTGADDASSGAKYTTVQGFITYLLSSAGSAIVGFLQAGTGAVSRTLQSKLRDTVCVKDFGAVGDNVADDTAAMQLAHDTGKIVYYPEGRYKFTRITMLTGGIIGDGKATILDSTDTTTGHIITHNTGDATALLVNEQGAVFRNFYLRVDTPTQKSSGAGIFIDGTATNSENYTTEISGVTVRNIPSCVHCTMASFLTIRDNYFYGYSVNGLYVDNDSALFGDNGDNSIYGNSFFTNGTIGPSAFGIKYRTGGGRIWGNKINGGFIGLDISPLRPTSIMLVYGNSIENQTLNCVRMFTDNAAATDFAMVRISGNQINAALAAGSAVYVQSSHLTWNDLIIDNNIIRFYTAGTAAIDIRNTFRFKVHGNTMELNSLGGTGINIAATCAYGHLENNSVNDFVTAHTANASTTTYEHQVMGRYSGAYDVPSLADGAGHTASFGVGGAEVGNTVLASLSVDLQGITMTAYISSVGTATVRWQNETGGVIDLASATIKLTAVRL